MPRLSEVSLASRISTSARESIEPSRNSHLLPTKAPTSGTPEFWMAFTPVLSESREMKRQMKKDGRMW